MKNKKINTNQQSKSKNKTKSKQETATQRQNSATLAFFPTSTLKYHF